MDIKDRADQVRAKLEKELKIDSIKGKLSKLELEVRKMFGLISTENVKIRQATKKADKVKSEKVIDTYSKNIDSLCKAYAKFEDELEGLESDSAEFPFPIKME